MGRLFVPRAEKLGSCQRGSCLGGALKEAEHTRAFGVRATFGNLLLVELTQFIEQTRVLQQDGTPWTRCQRVDLVTERHARWASHENRLVVRTVGLQLIRCSVAMEQEQRLAGRLTIGDRTRRHHSTCSQTSNKTRLATPSLFLKYSPPRSNPVLHASRRGTTTARRKEKHSPSINIEFCIEW